MALTRRTHNELDWPDWFRRPFLDWPGNWKDMMSEAELKVEEYQDEGTLVVRAEMPGIDPERDVDITVSDGMLRLSAERRSESKTEDKRGFHSEFRYGSFSRSLRLPAGATEADVNATYRDGILEVRIPIDGAEPEARKIPVQRG